MKEIVKALEPGAVTAEQLEKIGRYSRRPLREEEVFVFSVILCDNEVDRDFERFPTESLQKLGELFIGKTGVFDHSARAENQSARIFETTLLREGRENSSGEEYCCLKAWAYMVRCDKNEDLILEIDAGIKKEVSVGCAVEKVVCSVCGQEQKADPCAHRKGRRYGESSCHHLLVNPTDAYEWSFVAVPAQKNAGVTKGRRSPAVMETDTVELHKLFVREGEITLTGAQMRSLKGEFERLGALAEAGEQYLASLRGEVRKLALLAQPELSPEVAGKIAEGLDIPALQELKKSLYRTAERYYPLNVQLGGRAAGETDRTEDAFRI